MRQMKMANDKKTTSIDSHNAEHMVAQPVCVIVSIHCVAYIATQCYHVTFWMCASHQLGICGICKTTARMP